MIKSIALATITTLFLVGCGGGGGDDDGGGLSPVVSNPGKYNLWEYMTPSTSNTNTFTLSSNSIDSTYTSTYTVKSNRVEEVADYAQDEKTIYEKGADEIIVRFEKSGKSNGTYTLKLTADINDIVTQRKSECKLTRHLDSFKIAEKTFQDVLEITCGTTPGYYQKGVGEIAQIEDSSGKNIRVLSN